MSCRIGSWPFIFLGFFDDEKENPKNKKNKKYGPTPWKKISVRLFLLHSACQYNVCARRRLAYTRCV